MQHLKGKTAVITGAASGIGLALSEALFNEGMNVVMSDLNEAALRTEGARIDAGNDRIHVVVTDVSNQDAVQRLADEAVERFGDLSVAINNAGIITQGKSWEVDIEQWRRIIDINLFGVIHGVRAFLPKILASGEPGHIVNTASMAAVMAVPEIAPYVAAKHGVLGLSEALRAELAEIGAPVGVSVVMPGHIKTPLNPDGIISTATVAANVVDAIKKNRLFVFTDDHFQDVVDARLQQISNARSDVLPS